MSGTTSWAAGAVDPFYPPLGFKTGRAHHSPRSTARLAGGNGPLLSPAKVQDGSPTPLWCMDECYSLNR